MDVKEAIRIRKSIRQYESKAIPEDVVKELLDAARLAPSAKNKQSHKYFIIQDKETKDKLRENETCRQEFVYGAPLIIVCCAFQLPVAIPVAIPVSIFNYCLLCFSAFLQGPFGEAPCFPQTMSNVYIEGFLPLPFRSTICRPALKVTNLGYSCSYSCGYPHGYRYG